MATKPKCPMGMTWDPSSKKCVKPGTGDTPLDKLKKEKERMLKTKFKTGGMVNKKKKYGVGGPTTKSNSTPMEQSSEPNTPPTGSNKLTGNPRFKTGGMVNPNAKLQAAKSAGSKGVKPGVNPKAAASNTAKKPSKPRSKAPKKATPGRG